MPQSIVNRGVTKARKPGGAASRPVLSQSDFAYAGHYDVPIGAGGHNLNYAAGFTHRYVGGQLRFLTLDYASASTPRRVLVEFAAPASYGSAASAATQTWADISPAHPGWSANDGGWGLNWDATTSTLWMGEAVDYPSDAEALNTLGITYRSLGSGTVSGQKGYFGLAGITKRRIMGGAIPVPAWFQTAYGVGPFCTGYGGYFSRGTTGAGGGVSLGPTLYAFPDPAGYADGTEFTTSQHRALMDHGPLTGADWYAAGTPSTVDRGARNADVLNYFDGGDVRSNPATPPSAAPAALPTGNWLSPAPDGLGRWVWGDNSWDTGCWIDGASKQGFLLVPTLWSGKVFYMSSGTHCERRTFEVQVFDPAHFGQVVGGTRAAWAVQPSARWQIAPTGLVDASVDTSFYNGSGTTIAGATFDATTNTLYLLATFLGDGDLSRVRVYAYSVNC